MKESIVESNYSRACNRLIIIDQEGVLPMKQTAGRNMQEPSSKIISVLNEITKDERNTVFIISSQMKSYLHNWYAEKSP